MSDLLTIKEASNWATSYLKKEVSTSNISYLIQYGRIPKVGNNGNTLVTKKDLLNYYEKYSNTKAELWKDKLGDDLNWALSFEEYKESDTTKHVHRLHPYKGKFIPQLVEYFIDNHTDKFKTEVFFKKGDTILDPFCGSGTTLVQACELGINAIGVDISLFNTYISNSKIEKYNLKEIELISKTIIKKLDIFLRGRANIEFEKELLKELKFFNSQYFPSPDYKVSIRKGEINENKYSGEKEKEFLPVYHKLIEKFGIQLRQKDTGRFLDKWYIKEIRDEIDFVSNEIDNIENLETKQIFKIILSRTIRSCRATTHSDLATLVEPQITTYYCKKHGKICKPLFSISSWFKRYIKDTIKRLSQFEQLRTQTEQICLTGDSRNINIFEILANQKPDFAKELRNVRIDGIFSSPPYVGLIDYHEQHAYSYDLFGFERKDESEIGPLYKGQGEKAKESYTKGIADVLNNSKKYLKEDYNIFLVANDKYGLYPKIAELAGMKIVNQYKRPVLNRVEKDRNAYTEIIFHLKEDYNE